MLLWYIRLACDRTLTVQIFRRAESGLSVAKFQSWSRPARQAHRGDECLINGSVMSGRRWMWECKGSKLSMTNYRANGT